MEDTVMPTLTIGKMAKMAGVTNDTVRFYERCGLIEPAGRSASNYRLYHAEDAARLRFIKRAKELGFSLNEIKDLLALSRDPHATKADVKARTEEKAEKIRQKIHDLAKILQALEQLNDMCDGHGSADDCPILQSLNENDEPHSHQHRQYGEHGGVS
jgi:Zn(II)-responsive transcriptional regulator